MLLKRGNFRAESPRTNRGNFPRSLHLAGAAILLGLVLSILAFSPVRPSVEQASALGNTWATLNPLTFGTSLVSDDQPISLSSQSLAQIPAPSESPVPDVALGVPVDPVDLPGWREGTKWVTNNPDIQMHHWLQRLIDGQGGEADFDWARNMTILLLGDSVLREWLFQLCDTLVGGNKTRLTFREGVEERNEGWECVVPSTGTRFINGFVYGMFNYSKFPSDSPLLTNNFPVGPWLMEERIPQIKEEYIREEPDLIVVNSGAWEMITMYRRDVFGGDWHEDISHKDLEEFGARLRDCLHLVKTLWPSSKHLFLQMQPFRGNDTWTRWLWAQTLASTNGHKWDVDLSTITTPTQTMESITRKLPPLFTQRRVSQLATTYRRIVAEENWDSLDYWRIAEASELDEFYAENDPVHPILSSTQIILDFLLEKAWRLRTYGV